VVEDVTEQLNADIHHEKNLKMSSLDLDVQKSETDLEEKICEELGITKLEEEFMQTYNPLTVFCRVKEMFSDEESRKYELILKTYVKMYERFFYDNFMSLYKTYRGKNVKKI